MRKVKKPVDYLYLKWGKMRAGRICIKERNIAGLNTLEICISPLKQIKGEISTWEKGRAQRWKKKMKRNLKRKLRSYDISSCAVNGDWNIRKAFCMGNTGFYARKNELLLQGRYIFEQVCAGWKKNVRRKLLIYLECEKWSVKEIHDLLWIAKNFYEDIILASENQAEYEDMLICLFEECGLVVTPINLKEAKTELYDSVLFLVKKWQSYYPDNIRYGRAYMVAEQEEMENWYRQKVQGSRVTDVPVCFGGLCYEYHNKKIPYQLAVDMHYQKTAFCHKNGISFIAIYRLECYNEL